MRVNCSPFTSVNRIHAVGLFLFTEGGEKAWGGNLALAEATELSFAMGLHQPTGDSSKKVFPTRSLAWLSTLRCHWAPQGTADTHSSWTDQLWCSTQQCQGQLSFSLNRYSTCWWPQLYQVNRTIWFHLGRIKMPQMNTFLTLKLPQSHLWGLIPLWVQMNGHCL